MSLAANGGFVLPMGDKPWMEVTSGAAFNINLTAATQVGVHVVYTVEK
jgi:hypothetical protein